MNLNLESFGMLVYLLFFSTLWAVSMALTTAVRCLYYSYSQAPWQVKLMWVSGLLYARFLANVFCVVGVLSTFAIEAVRGDLKWSLAVSFVAVVAVHRFRQRIRIPD